MFEFHWKRPVLRHRLVDLVQKSTEMADFKIPDSHFTVPVEELFDLMASRMIEFTTSRNM